MRVTEVPVPKNGMDKAAVSPRALCIEQSDGCIVGVMHSKKPLPDGLAIHVSVSKSRWTEILPVTTSDLRDVENAVLNLGLEWPAEVELLPFSAGPFVGRGIHVWQKQSKPIADLLTK